VGPVDFFARQGRFRFPEAVVQENAAALLAVMAEVLVIRCEFLWGERLFDYVGLCEQFDGLEEGDQPPIYDAEVEQDENGAVTAVTWKRMA
jgi:hypothetical protein